jgi:hypothetical protein
MGIVERRDIHEVVIAVLSQTFRCDGRKSVNEAASVCFGHGNAFDWSVPDYRWKVNWVGLLSDCSETAVDGLNTELSALIFLDFRLKP